MNNERMQKILDKQHDFQKLVGVPIDTIVESERNRISEMFIYKAMEELVEARREFPSILNEWSKSNKPANAQRVKEEFSDVFLFLSNLLLAWHISWDEFLEQVETTQANNYDRIKIKKMSILKAEMMKVPEPVMAGNGHYTPKYMFVGQNPGLGLDLSHTMNLTKYEDQQTSFGLLLGILNQIILREDSVFLESYYTNLVKVKTPNNDKPYEDLTSFWFEFFQKELEILQFDNPDMKIVAMGNWTYDQLVQRLPNLKIYKITHPSAIMRGYKTKEEYIEEIKSIL